MNLNPFTINLFCYNIYLLAHYAYNKLFNFELMFKFKQNRRLGLVKNISHEK